MIAASPALLARERQILARYTDAVAALLGEETGRGPNDLCASVVANALVGLHAALIAYVRERLLDGPVDVGDLARDLRREGSRAIGLLRGGLGDYCVRSPASVFAAQVSQATLLLRLKVRERSTRRPGGRGQMRAFVARGCGAIGRQLVPGPVAEDHESVASAQRAAVRRRGQR